MDFSEKVIPKLTRIPILFWIITVLVLIFPFIEEVNELGNELIWFVYVIPAFIFSYYWGLWGGILTAFLTVIAQFCWEIYEKLSESGDYHSEDYSVIILTAFISFGIAFGIGILADKLKKNQKTIEKINKELECKNKQLDDMSHIDELTGLLNRRGLIKIANYWGEIGKLDNEQFGVLFIDLDKFKPVNDTYGHYVGDKLLKEVAKRLKGCVTGQTVTSRIGGDEFAIFLPKANEPYAIQISKRIIKELSTMFLIERKEIFITPSIGISLSSDDTIDLELLLQQADIAMYDVKNNGKNGYAVFNSSMKEVSENRTHLELLLRKAIDREELCLYYQPQLNVATGDITSYEALIRWHSNGRVVSPAEFIPLAEETGLIIPIGQWVIETACRQIKTWKEAGFLARSVSVNVSSYQFQHPNFIFMVQKVLEDTQIDPNSLRLELTESVILGYEKEMIRKLEKLKQLGVSLSIDDFGSGYSSLSYLKNFPIDEIKMDKSFIDGVHCNEKDRSLVKTIINLGHSLNTKIVAEGVETKDQLEFLQAVGCDMIQGYLIGKPEPAK